MTTHRPRVFLALTVFALATCAWVLTGGVVRVAGAAFAASPNSDAAGQLARLEAAHARLMVLYRKRIDGRSVFHRVRRKVVAVVEPDESPDDPVVVIPATPAAPPPDLVGLVGDEAWFQTTDRWLVRVSRGHAEAGLTVLDTDAPFSARIDHEGRVQRVILFERTPEEYFRACCDR